MIRICLRDIVTHAGGLSNAYVVKLDTFSPNNNCHFSPNRFAPFDDPSLRQQAMDALSLGLLTVHSVRTPHFERVAELLLSFSSAPALVLMLVAAQPQILGR